MNESSIEIFKTEDGGTEVQVVLKDDTVWLNLNQISDLFKRDKSVISRHIRNVFKEGELEKKPTVANFATVQIEGTREIQREIEYYNLDIIISVGYRIKSQRGTQFRVWANRILKEYLLKGYTLNEKYLAKQNKQLKDLQEAVKIIGDVLKLKEISGEESKSLLAVISDYAYALDILDQYDYQSLEINGTSGEEIYRLGYEEAIAQIQIAKQYYGNSDLFGNEKDESFRSSLAVVYQTFDGEDLYPSVEEKAANLLYFVTKNHSFSDGNKRIAAFLFLYFMEKNGILYDHERNKRIADNALVALTLMIAVIVNRKRKIQW